MLPIGSADAFLLRSVCLAEQAGLACREMGWLSMAFVFLNRYLDLSEAIDEGDAGMIDNSDFVGTDIPSPYDFALPKEQWLDEDDREDVRLILAIELVHVP